MWRGVYDDEWDGNVPVGPSGQTSASQVEEGEIVFTGEKIPWQVGTYEVRRARMSCSAQCGLRSDW